MTSAAMLAELERLAGQAGKAIYRRLAIVRDVLADHKFINTEFKSEPKAFEVMEAKYFGDLLLGHRTLSQLLSVLATFPSEEEWKQEKWNLSIMLAKWDELRTQQRKQEAESNGTTEGRTRARVKKDEYQAVLQQAKEQEVIIQHVAKEKEALLSETDQLRQRVRDLERENVDLRARVNELQRLLEPSLSRR